MIHVLMFHDKPIAAAERLERLSLKMADYTPAQQSHMWIQAVQVLD